MTGRPKIYMIDGSSYLYRAYHTRTTKLSNSAGEPTWAVYIFIKMLLKLIKREKPERLAISFDKGRDTFRKEMYEMYKANRPEAPPDLISQGALVREAAEAFGIPIAEREGCEADDALGSLAKRFEKEGYDVVLVTGDKDFCQLVTERVTLLDTMKDKATDIDGVMERFGVAPNLVADSLALQGDASDNIPGAPGIGEKTARELVAKYGGVEEIIAKADELDLPEKKRLSIKENADIIRLSKRLATIKTDLSFDFTADDFLFKGVNRRKIIPLLKRLEFYSLVNELDEGEAEKTEPENDAAPSPRAKEEENIRGAARAYETVFSAERLYEIIGECRNAGAFAFDAETTSLEASSASLVGVSLCWGAGRAAYVPVGHRLLDSRKQIPAAEAVAALKPLLEDRSTVKIAHNLKYDMQVLAGRGIAASPPYEDTMLISYVLNPAQRSHSLDSAALALLGEKGTAYKDITSRGKTQISFAEVDFETATAYSCEDADFCLRVYKLTKPKLAAEKLDDVYSKIELPLVKTLAKIETTGVKIDVDRLKRTGEELAAQIREFEKEIYEYAGGAFNVNSPAQLGEILFGRLKLPHKGKTKGGKWSTDVDALEKLADAHPLPALILKYRQAVKLKTSFVDALIGAAREKTLRVHTSYNQAVATTGRLSSSDPNLQNIPVRTPLGRGIRKAFVAEEGFVILSADYSQIELRLLAQVSGDRLLTDSFVKGEDVHARTASEVFGVKPEEVTSDLRRRAKAINFGIVYGQSAHGLSESLKITHQEAKNYIEGYFERYKGIAEYMKTTIENARKDGAVYTAWGRKIPTPEINSSNAQARQFAERAAINAPIQGAAADLIKIAMINVDARLEREGMASRMIMQVHDELVFEAKTEEAERLESLVREEMMNAGSGVVAVPLAVEIKFGANWDEAH